MITSRQIILISEDWIKQVRGSGTLVDVYSNPGSSDVAKLYASLKRNNIDKEIRFIADANKRQVYVWDGYLATHNVMFSELGYGTLDYEKSYFAMFGMGKISGNKIVFMGTFDSTINFIRNRIKFLNMKTVSKQHLDRVSSDLQHVFSYNWSFVNTYISGFANLLEKEKKDFMDWLKK
jgi:hypothetical protein